METAILDLDRTLLLENAKKELQLKSPKAFIKRAWREIEGCQMKWGRHLDVLCNMMEEVKAGRVKRLIINMPPRHMKSTGFGVCFIPWLWLDHPWKQGLSLSYQQGLTVRDNIKSRRIIQSDWYQGLCGFVNERDSQAFYNGPIKLTDDVNNKLKFDNNYMGYRIAGSIGGATTGHGGNIIILDDPNNVLEAESDTIRNEANFFFDEVLQTRLNDPKEDCIIVIQQRTHEDDTTGHILEKYGLYNEETNPEGYVHLCLPARYEGHEIDPVTGEENPRWICEQLGWRDWRTEEDEPLWPEQFGDAELSKLETALGAYGAAGQLQQRPAPRGGGMFKTEFLQEIERVPPEYRFKKRLRYWDFAATKRKKGQAEPCATAGVRMSLWIHRDNKMKLWVVEHVVRGWWDFPERDKKMKQTARLDGVATEIWFEQEGAGAGKEVAALKINAFAGYIIRADPPSANKEVRAEPFSIQMENGNVAIMVGSWNKAYKKELENFPLGKLKDQVDASSGAFNKLSGGKKGGVW